MQVPGHVGWKLPAVVGKSGEGSGLPLNEVLRLPPVVPVTYAFPAESTAMPKPMSVPVPPRNVEYISDALPDFVGSSSLPIRHTTVEGEFWLFPRPKKLAFWDTVLTPTGPFGESPSGRP